MYDENIIIYISVFSKMEYIINQVFRDYHNSMFIDIDLMKYSIIKAVLTYRPQNVIKAIYEDPKVLVQELRNFFIDRIQKNRANLELKSRENTAFEQILILLNEIKPILCLDWLYNASFTGFSKFLNEIQVQDYSLVIDKEGDSQCTVEAARLEGIQNLSEGDSKYYVGIRMADMLIGLISRIMQSLSKDLVGNYTSDEIKKTLLQAGWFVLNDKQLNLYKRLHKIICLDNKYWYKTYAGIYSDDLVAFISLLQFMNHFENADMIRNGGVDMQPEYYNAFTLDALQRRYNVTSHKLKMEPITNDSLDYFYNQRGAKVYKDDLRQPRLTLKEGQNKIMVLSVGFSQKGTPTVTINENETTVCYRLPNEYSEWAMTVVGMADMGEVLFPAEVIFTKEHEKYYADIL
ncbi:MAG: hypothetical protein ACERKZ_00680 [Lachnotalea sp.]